MLALINIRVKLNNPEVLIKQLKKYSDYRSSNIFMSDIYKDYYGRITEKSFRLICKKMTMFDYPQYHLLEGSISDNSLHLKAGFHVSYIILFIVLYLLFISQTGTLPVGNKLSYFIGITILFFGGFFIRLYIFKKVIYSWLRKLGFKINR